ncbi:MAG: NUDIX domain-containing protein [Dysgonamonadaceae bacterium]|jgi:ADP-ribose pyrophosphatase YjhB (NUDIX family)|nr:NUDIX domain-containing protein [Dysgonamonadaceae bacterium]
MHPLALFRYCPKCGSPRWTENDFKSKKCADCGFIYYFNSSAAVAAFIIDPNERLLVAKRAHEPAKGTLDLPGGFVDLYETGEEAVKREILEETGLKINRIQYLFSLPNLYAYSGFEVHTLDMFFRCEIENLSGLRAADDVEKLLFLPKSKILPERFGLPSIQKAVDIFFRYQDLFRVSANQAFDQIAHNILSNG